MAEYIERMSAIATACKGCNKEFPNEPCEPSECYIQQGLFNVTAADVVEVVRCKDCKHYKTRSQSAKWKPKAPCCTRAANIFTKPDDFCSYGEKREV